MKSQTTSTIYFIERNREAYERLQSPDSLPTIDKILPSLNKNIGSVCWISQTYINLKNRGYPVKISNEIIPDAINVIHTDDLRLGQLPSWGFLVIVQADRARPYPANLLIVQNKRCIIESNSDLYLPLWTQPGLVERSDLRGNNLTSVAYFGIANYTTPFVRANLSHRLQEIGISLSLRCNPKEWHDYSDVDVVLAFRDVSNYHKDIKPPSKLLNAWRAGCVAIMGAESAFQQVGRPGHDYIEVSSIEEVVEWCNLFKKEPCSFLNFIRNGRQAAAAYTDDSIAEMWACALWGPVQEHYEEWLLCPRWLRRAYTTLRLPFDVARRRIERRRFIRGTS